jgi:hypothetical protein
MAAESDLGQVGNDDSDESDYDEHQEESTPSNYKVVFFIHLPFFYRKTLSNKIR